MRLRLALSLLFAPCLLALLAEGARAQTVELGWPFGDSAVLQRNEPIPIWGQATPGSVVTVELATQQLATVAGPTGDWEVTFPPSAADATGIPLRAFCGTASVESLDILIGDVWVCGGQSNMDFRLGLATSAATAVPAANIPLLRLCNRQPFVNFTRDALTPAELQIVLSDDYYTGEWLPSMPTNAPPFSAIGFFFGRELVAQLGVPIGVIDLSLHGSAPETWIPLRSLLADPYFGQTHSRLRDRSFMDYFGRPKIQLDLAPWIPARPIYPRPRHYFDPGFVWEKEVEALTRQPIKGVIWFQGEGCAHQPVLSDRLGRHLIESWRAMWQDPALPFLYVQLPGRTVVDYSEYREVQAGWLELPATEMVVTLDISDPAEAHPPNKAPVGERLARAALKRAYGFPLEASGPIYETGVRLNDELWLSFTHDAGLRWAPGHHGMGFEIAGSNLVYVPAAARIEQGSVVLSSPLVPVPVAARYAWGMVPDWGLENDDALPAVPFRASL